MVFTLGVKYSSTDISSSKCWREFKKFGKIYFMSLKIAKRKFILKSNFEPTLLIPLRFKTYPKTTWTQRRRRCRGGRTGRRSWCSTEQYSTVQYSTVQCSTVQYSTVHPLHVHHPRLQAPAPGHAAEAVPRRAAALPAVTLALRGVPPTLSGKQEVRLCLGPLHRQRRYNKRTKH